MRRVLPAVTWALAMLFLAPVVPVQGGSSLLRDGFESGLGKWRVTEPDRARVATVAGAASTGELGLRVASPRGVEAGVSRRTPDPLRWARLAVDLRRETRDGARLAAFRGPSGWVLVASVREGGRLRLAGPGWRVDTEVRIPVGRWVRLALAIDVQARRVTILTDGQRRQVLRRRTARMTSVHLAGGPGPRGLSYDRFVLSGTPVDGPDPSPSPDPGTEYRFEGRGSDHGVGMSQLGAIGRARGGQTPRRILTHYYQGTELETRPVEDRIIRVVILQGVRASVASPLRVCGRRGRWRLAGVEGGFPQGACARFRSDSDSAHVDVVAADGTTLHEGRAGDTFVEPAEEDTLLEVPARGTRDLFRGSLRVLTSKGRARVVDHVTVGDYLRGVLPVEMGPSRPGAALRAQAIASRSYAVEHLHPANDVYDILDDSRHQVYDGVVVEADPTDRAIAGTAGVVLTYEGKVINAMYHAAGGGATEDARNVFTPADGSLGSDTPYLRGSPDRDAEGKPWDAASSYDAWHTGAFTLPQLSRIMASDPRTDVGRIRRLVLSDRGVSGRLISVTLVGEDGTRKKVAGWLFKKVYNDHRTAGPALLSTLLFLDEAP